MTLTDKEIHDLGTEIDKDGSGVFEFSEFVELVKVLLLRLRQAQEATETVEDMEEVLGELEEELKAKNKEAKRLANTVFEMRKGGAHVIPQPSTLRDVTAAPDK
jgi:Ca2+-binding EF-hand superfamily protein